MLGSIIFIIVALIFLVLAIRIGREDKFDKFLSEGIINDVMYTDTGNAWYKVSCIIDGKPVVAQSITYSSSTKTLKPEEHVKINYYYTKPGRVMVDILDDRIISLESMKKTFTRGFLVTSIVLAIIAVVLLIKYII